MDHLPCLPQAVKKHHCCVQDCRIEYQIDSGSPSGLDWLLELTPLVVKVVWNSKNEGSLNSEDSY